MNSLVNKRCISCEGGMASLKEDAAKKLLEEIHGWQLGKDNKSISKEFNFKNFLRTMSFVNAVAWIANQENHHPVLEVGYNSCRVCYSTHAIDGLSENDFICAAKIDKLLN